jgi:hypothetical protein
VLRLTKSHYDKVNKERALVQSRPSVITERISRIDLDQDRLKTQFEKQMETFQMQFKTQLEETQRIKNELCEERSQALLAANSYNADTDADEIKLLQLAGLKFVECLTKADDLMQRYDDALMDEYYLSRAFDNMTGEEVFSNWGLSFSYDCFPQLNHEQVRLLRRCLRMYGYPGAENVVLRNKFTGLQMWQEICHIVGIEVPPRLDNADDIQNRSLALQLEALAVNQESTGDESSRIGGVEGEE